MAQGRFATVFSLRGDAATAAELAVRVNEKASLAIALPPGARLFQVSVNGENMAVVREGDTHFFYVTPSPDPREPARVAFAYEVRGNEQPRGKVALQAPAFNVPLENVEWQVIIPEGWELEGHRGTMTIRQSGPLSLFGLDEYLSLASRVRKEKVAETNALISRAGEYLRQGDQDRARQALNRAAKTTGIDEATNEDARVQLLNLYNQQAVLGLNTVRQRLYLDNKSRDTSMQNDQIEQAASVNPILQGRMDFQLDELAQSLQGNSLEETAALRRVADRIVSQQIASEPAPRAISLTLPRRGTQLEFSRSVQVDGEAPLTLELTLAQTDRKRSGSPLPVFLALLLLGGLLARKR